MIEYLARERALRMAQREAETGLLPASQIIERARCYEAYLRAKPIPVISSSSECESQA